MVTPVDVEISQSLMQLLHGSPQRHQESGNRLQLQKGHILQQKDQPCRQFHILLSVSCINNTDNDLLLLLAFYKKEQRPCFLAHDIKSCRWCPVI